MTASAERLMEVTGTNGTGCSGAGQDVGLMPSESEPGPALSQWPGRGLGDRADAVTADL